MGYYVSRQDYWTMDEDAPTLAVEIVSGGPDNSSPDELTPKYRNLGEGETYTDPRDAVKAALNIRHAWEHDTGESIPITGFTTGYGMVLPDEYSDDEARAWAEKEYAELPKCDHCGDLLGSDVYFPMEYDGGDERFCSEYCAETAEHEFLDSITTAVHCTACDAMLPKDTRGWCDECGADYEHLERVYE